MNRHLLILWLLFLLGAGPTAGTDADRLIAAAEAGDLETVRDLLTAGADVNATSHSGITALMMAAHGGHISLVRYLLVRRADPDIQTENGVTALIAAVKEGHMSIVELLLERGARVDLALAGGQTAREVAVDEGHPEIVALLDEAAQRRPGGDGLPTLPPRAEEPFEISDFHFERVRKADPFWTFACRFHIRNLTDRPLGVRITFLCIDSTGHTVDNNNKREVFLGPEATKTINETISVSAMQAYKVVEIQPQAKLK
ncbi:MAG: ankyrin repeat domain-containing protein [Acidobacteria bacterium]|nr:ankyrin repeat domain-containing protein [Acidobacteriota bacterium]